MSDPDLGLGATPPAARPIDEHQDVPHEIHERNVTHAGESQYESLNPEAKALIDAEFGPPDDEGTWAAADPARHQSIHDLFGEIEPELVGAGGPRLRVDVYHHFPEGLPVAKLVLGGILGIDATISEPVPPPPPTNAAHTAILRITNQQGEPMTTPVIAVDTDNEILTLGFLDEATPPQPAQIPQGASATAASDTQTVATVGAQAQLPDGSGWSWPLAFGGTLGDANLSVVLVGANDENGQPIVDPQPVTINYIAGPAGSASLGLGAAPAPSEPSAGTTETQAPSEPGAGTATTNEPAAPSEPDAGGSGDGGSPGATGGDGTTSSATVPADAPQGEVGP